MIATVVRRAGACCALTLAALSPVAFGAGEARAAGLRCPSSIDGAPLGDPAYRGDPHPRHEVDRVIELPNGTPSEGTANRHFKCSYVVARGSGYPAVDILWIEDAGPVPCAGIEGESVETGLLVADGHSVLASYYSPEGSGIPLARMRELARDLMEAAFQRAATCVGSVVVQGSPSATPTPVGGATSAGGNTNSVPAATAIGGGLVATAAGIALLVRGRRPKATKPDAETAPATDPCAGKRAILARASSHARILGTARTDAFDLYNGLRYQHENALTMTGVNGTIDIVFMAGSIGDKLGASVSKTFVRKITEAFVKDLVKEGSKDVARYLGDQEINWVDLAVKPGAGSIKELPGGVPLPMPGGATKKGLLEGLKGLIEDVFGWEVAKNTGESMPTPEITKFVKDKVAKPVTDVLGEVMSLGSVALDIRKGMVDADVRSAALANVHEHALELQNAWESAMDDMASASHDVATCIELWPESARFGR